MSNQQPSNPKSMIPESDELQHFQSLVSQGQDLLLLHQNTNEQSKNVFLPHKMELEHEQIAPAKQYSPFDSTLEGLVMTNQVKCNLSEEFSAPSKINLKSKQIGDNNHWNDFVNSVLAFEKPSDFLQNMLKKINSKGPFSQQVTAFIESNFSKPTGKKIYKNYQQNMLKPLVEPILNIGQVSLQSMQSQETKVFYKSIGQGSQDHILRILELFLDSEHPQFTKIIQDLLKLYCKPQQVHEEKEEQIVSKIQEKSENKLNNEDEMIALFNKQTQKFINYLQQNKIIFQNSWIKEIMIIKFNNGNFSPLIDDYIRDHKDMKKLVKKKVQQCFDDLFRDFDLSQQIMIKFQLYGFDGKDVKQIKSLIRKNEFKKISQKLNEYLEEQEQVQELTKKLISQRPQQLIDVKFSLRSLSSSSSPKKQALKQNEDFIKHEVKQTIEPKMFKQTQQKKKGESQILPNQISQKETKLVDINTKTQKVQESDPKKFIEKKSEAKKASNQQQIKKEEFYSKRSQQKSQEQNLSHKKKPQYVEKKVHPANDPASFETNGKGQPVLKLQIIDQKQGGWNSIDPTSRPKIYNDKYEKSNQRQFGHQNIKRSHENEDFPTPQNAHGPNNFFPEFEQDNQKGKHQKEIPFYEQPEQIFYDIVNADDRSTKNNSQQRMMNHQKRSSSSRFILIVKEKKTKLQFFLNSRGQNFNLNQILIDQWERGQIAANIFRIDPDQKANYYKIQEQKQSWLSGKKSITFSKTELFNQHLIRGYLMNSQCYLDLHADIMSFYFMTVLCEYSKKNYVESFWQTLLDLNKLADDKEKTKIFCLISNWYLTKKYTFNSECSRILLYYTVRHLNSRISSMDLENIFLQQISNVIGIDNYNHDIPYFQRSYTQQVQMRYVTNCTLNRFNKNLNFNDTFFLYNFNVTFGLMQNLQQKIKYLQSMKDLLNEKVAQLYPMIKDYINLSNHSIVHFLALRLTLINIHKLAYQYNQYAPQEENKRVWLVHIIRDIKEFIFHLNQNQLKKQQEELKKLNNYQTQIEEILLGKNRSDNYFLFIHESFFDFYSELVKMKEIKNFDLYKYFSKYFTAENRKNKAIEYVILKSSKSPHMISFMCSQDAESQKNLQQIIKKINTPINLLQIVKFWFENDFKKQQNHFFIKVFLYMMEYSKIEELNVYQFLKTIECYENEKISKEIELFERSVVQKMKRFCQLPELPNHLLQIKDVRKPVRVIYLQELSTRVQQTKPSLKKLQQVASLIVADRNIDPQDREILLRKLFQNRNDKDKDTLKQQIIQYYSEMKKELRALGYYPNFSKILKEIVKDFDDKEMPYSIIQQIDRLKLKITTENDREDFAKLGAIAKNVTNQVQNIKKKNQNLIKVLRQYDDQFKEQIDELLEWNKELPIKSVKQSLANIRRFKEYLEYSVQINSLMKIPLWKKQEIKLLPDLLTMRNITIESYGKLIDSFEHQTLGFIEFKRYFRVDLLSTLLENINDRDENFKRKLTDFVSYLDQKTLRNYAIAIQAVNKVSQDIQKRDFFESRLYEIVDFLQNPPRQITIQQAFKMIKIVNEKFKQLQFDILNENEEILKTLIFKNKYKRVFDMITQKKIDPQTVLNDLKEYINDIENSILKIQDIKELENVVLFQEWHNNAKTFRGFLEVLRREVKAKKLQLSENIFNADSKLNQIDQMIDSSSNRETSFKYDLQEILNYSVVKIKNENGFAHVQIEIEIETDKITQKQIMVQSQSVKKEKGKNQVFTFKKLTQFKDKAILLVSDFEKSNQNQAIMQQTIDLLKQFLELYKILEEIEIVLGKAVIYGYNPADLQQKRTITKNNYEEIKKMKDLIQLIAKQWIEGMKQIYEKSYLLTHFMGPRLNAFINDTLNFKFSPLIKQIIDLDEKQFVKQMDSLRYIGLDRQNTTQIKKVKEICRIFHKLEAKTLEKFERRSIFEQDHIKNQVELITCNSVQNYYYALVKGNSRPEMNEILYLQKETSFEQIEVFIKRAIIKNHRTHYFIGVHYLPAEVQLKFIDLLNEYVRTQEKRKKFNKCKLCFIDKSPIEKVYLHLSKKQLFNAKPITDTHLKTNEQTKSLFNIIGDTYLIESRIAGLGKTYWAEKKKPNSNVVYFSIAGHVHFSRLLQRLKAKKFAENQPNTFIVQIGHVENKNKLEIFLFQLIFFKGFNFKQFFFLPKNTTVIIEMQNTFQTVNKYDYYSILKIIKEKKQKYVWINNFKLEELEPNFSNNIEEAFTFTYLIYIYQKSILRKELSFTDFQKDWRGQNTKICSKQDARKLMKIYFLNQLERSNTQPTFWLYHSFIKLLFVAFKTFSQTGFFSIQILDSSCRSNRNLGLENVRLDFLNCCIKNSIQFLEATINTNEFEETEENQNKIKNQKDFRSSLSKFPFLIMPAYDFQNYRFVYLNSQEVNISIKSLIVSQQIFKYIKYNKHGYDQTALRRRLDPKIVENLFSEDALEHLKEDQLQRQIYSILHVLSGSQLFNVSDRMTIKEFKSSNERIQNYSITLDNFFKMCLIIQRAVAHIPIIIMGESGVGKTALIKFLVEVVFQQRFLVFNIHAGVDQQKLVECYNQIKKISSELQIIPGQKLWVFFDEFNTSDELSYIKEMIIDRRFQGEKVPENVVLVGACNPYRKKKESIYKRAGIKKKVVEQKNQNLSDLAFKVKPPPLSMIQFMWDYQQLQFKQNMNYISKILQVLELSNHEIVVKTITEIHELFKNTFEISSVSLRDVTRFRELYLWFRINMPRTQDNLQNLKRNPNYDLNEEVRAIALSMSFCYSLRIANRSQRKDLLKKMTEFLQFDVSIQKIVQNEQIDYVERLKISSERIAINFSLRENVFTTLVCIMNKIPVLIIGNPGNSKSLSIRMISSNLRGLNSESEFCRKFPELSIIYFQGSQACTSKGVETVFQKAIKSNDDFKKKKQKQPGLGDVENCVLFDEIGLAQKSVHNPLKVLHSKLQTDQKQICFIGISNWELDAAKMSRFLVLSRSNPEKEQLQDTAVKILQSYLKREAPKYEKTFKEMSDWYYEFVDRWDEENRNNQREGFFGLRDFYCYVKDVAAELEHGENSKLGSALNIDDIIRRAIKSNFDGQQDSVEMFLRISGLFENEKQHITDPIKLVEDNLSKGSSRCLLLIVRGDALLPIIHRKLKKNGQKRRIDCIYGSTFASDQQSEEYNLEITSIIISHMSRGTLLTFKNPNNSIQTSLYDVFNKSFTISGPKKYCRVAVGANSNPKCVVHQSFASVVFIDEDIIKNTDLAFLNRFQKHFLTLSNVISNFQKEFVHQITRWIENLLKFSKTTQYRKQEQYLINSSEESIVTLILRYRDLFDTDKQSGIKKVKKTLLKNATEHFYIALKDEKKNLIPAALKAEVNLLLKEIENQRSNKSKEMIQNLGFQDLIQEETVPKNKIIFTYDQNIYSSPTYMFCDEKTLKIRISEVKSERQLRKSLKDAFSSQKIGNIHILIDFQKEFYHLNFAAFLITGLKQEIKSNKTIYIIIKLSQSSLQNAGRDHINISYLLDFEQRYIGSLTKAMSFIEMIEKKTVKELYIEKKMDESFDNFYHEAMMRFRLMQNQKDILKGVSSEDIKEFQFEQIMRMNENEMFRTEAKNFIYQNLSDTKIDISVILNNKEDRNLCSSPQESFDKYLQNCVIQAICTFFDRAYRNGLFFAFDLPALFKFLNNHYDVKVLETIYEYIEENYKIFLSHLVNMFIKEKSLHVNVYLKQYNSNVLEIKPMCLLPMGLIELSYISSSSEDSLFKTSSKILQLLKNNDTQAIQDCQISIEKCLSILNEKSVFLKIKKGPFDFEKFLNENWHLQIFYFFDMISKIFSQSIETIQTEEFPLEKIVYLFVSIFKKLQMKQKVLLLSLSKELWSNIFNLWILWITHNQSPEFHRQIEFHYLSNDVIMNQDNEAHKLPQLLKELCQSTMSLQQRLLHLNINNFCQFGMQKYLSFFRKTYLYTQKIRLICMDLDVETSLSLKATKRFFDLMDEIYDREEIEEQLTIFLTNTEKSFESKVQNYLSNVLMDENRKQAQRQHILSYLSLDIYGMWIERLNKSRQIQNVKAEIQACIESFIIYSNKYSSFANNSSFFLQNLFQDIIYDENTVEENIEAIEHEESDMIEIIDRNLSLDSNFAVALGNYFLEDLKTKAQNEEGEQVGGMNEYNNDESFLKKYFEHFQRLMKRNSYQNKVFEVYSIEFLKFYCLKYLNAIENNDDQSTTWEVDKLLSEKSQIADTLRLYLLKNILYRNQKMTTVKDNYLENKRCKWLEHFRTLVCGKTFEILVPPPFQEEEKKLTGLITRFRDEQYENIEIFEQIIEESFVSPITKYEFLTFMMNDVYTRSCSQDKIKQMLEMINNNNHYKDPTNTVQMNLLTCYINHKISQVLKYDEREMETQQAKIQEFVRNQLVFINYLNIFVSCSKEQCPLIEMFFDMNGNVPEDYVDWVENRFLINGRENQSVSILKRFIELGDNTPGYYKCSNECDMFYTIGGSGGFGCQLPRVESTCGWCKKTIGGTNHVLTRVREGARKVDLTQLPKQLEIIREKKILQVLNDKLNGYSFAFGLQEMKKQIISNKRLPQSAKYILQQMIFSVWSFLASTNQISEDTVKQFFHMNSRAFQVESFEVIGQFYNMETKALNLNQEDQSDLVWHLGISKQIMKFIIEYKGKLTNQMRQRMGLIRCAGRDMFEEYLVNNVVLKHSFGNEKLALVNKSRCNRAGVNLSDQKILRQTGNFEQYLNKYPKIRLIKVLYEDKSPSFDNMVEEYREKIGRDYKILSYFIEHEEEVDKLRKYRTLYTFISKILKLFNLKVTRQQAKEKSLIKLYENLYRSNIQASTSEFNSFREEITKFCEVWNELREERFELRYGCHSFGFMNEVAVQLDLNSQAVNFFPDIKYKGHQKGEMILSLLQVTAQEYNNTCRQINHAKMGSQKYRDVEIFNSKSINPTQIHAFTKTLELYRELIEDSYIANYSNWSIQYGCGLPHYSIDKIESLMVEHIVGCHNINEEINEYDTIDFIGEQLNFISQIRDLQNQLEWESIPRKQEIEKFIYTIKHDEPDSFLKEINSIKGSIELVLHYFKLKKGVDIKDKTIEDFIRQNKILIMSKVLSNQPLLSNIEMKYILGFYEFVELHTLKSSIECLDDSYKKEKLSQMEIKNLNMFLDELKRQYKAQEEINYHLSVAIHRFVVRSLLLVERKESLELFSFLYEGYDLWPHKFNIERLSMVHYFREAFSITLTKMQSLLEFIPFDIKKTKTEVILMDKKQTQQEIIKKAKEPQRIIKIIQTKGKKKNL